MLTTNQLLLLAILSCDLDSFDTLDLAVIVLLLRRQNLHLQQSECSSLLSTPHQSMEQRPLSGQRDHNSRGHNRDLLLEKELEWLAKEDRGRRLRVERQTFHKLLLKLYPDLTKAQNGLKVSVARCLSTTLRFLCTSSTLQEIKIDSHISPQMLSRIIVETCDSIIEALKDYIKVFF